MRIENDRYTVCFDPQNGAILDVVDRVAGFSLIAEPRLAENFRLLLPLPENGANYILGKEQRLSRWEEIPNGVVLRWDGPLAGFDIRPGSEPACWRTSALFRWKRARHSRTMPAGKWIFTGPSRRWRHQRSR